MNEPLVIIYAVDTMHHTGTDFVLNAPIFMNMQGNVPSIIQQISNIAEFSINIMIVTEYDKGKLKTNLSKYINCSYLTIFNITEFMYYIAKLDKTPVIVIDGCIPNVDVTVFQKFYDKYKKDQSRIQASMVKNVDNIFTNDFSELRFEDENILYKDGLLFCIKANILMNLLIQDPSMSTIDLLDGYMTQSKEKGLTCYIVEDQDLLKFMNMRVKNNSMRLRDPVFVI